MVEPGEGLESRVASLEEAVRSLEQRLAAAERAIPRTFWNIAAEAEEARRVAEARAAAGPDAPAAPSTDATTAGLAALVGRTLVVLGGAFLLRALTDGDVLSKPLGVAVGLAYAGIWLWAAARAARLGRRRDAAFHGATTSVIAFPLVWEGVVRFGALSPPLAAAATLVFGGVSLWVAWRRRLRVLAWVSVVAPIVVDAGLVLVTGAVVSLGGVLCVLGAAAVVVSHARSWVPLRWTVALLVALTLVAPPVTAGWRLTSVDPVALAGLQLAVLAIALGGIGARLIGLRARVTAYDAVAAGLFLLIGFELAPRLLVPGAPRVPAFGVAAFVLLGGVVAATRLERVREHHANVGCLVAVGTFLVVEGFRHLVGGQEAAVAWTLVAVLGAWFGADPARPALRGGAAALLLAAAGGSGLLRQIAGALLLGAADAWTPPSMGMVLVVVGAAVAYGLIRWDVSGERGASFSVPAFLVVFLLGLSLATLLVALVAPALTGAGTLQGDAGALAVLRTSVLIALAWALAWAGRSRTRPELLWAMGVVLGITAPKLVLDDLIHGRPATLFGTFVLLGVTLMALPLLLRRKEAEPAA
ncbi:MAG: hypothetical protein AMXMBFR64_10480 [Myxococcales bacterium]